MWGYILSHWRGEQSLARSYLVNMLLFTFVLSVCLNTSERILQDDLNSPWQIFAWVAGIYSACFIIWIWQAVGCWRSANGRITKTGKLGWARLVQAMIVLGVFANLAGLKSVAQMTNEVFNVVTRTDNMQDVHITLLDGTELAINGFITFDVPVEVEKYLKYNPNIKYLHLNSPGGRIGPARDLRDLWRSIICPPTAKPAAIAHAR
jgi:hypothetical protein